jgi:uncharacterized membrane-anchored protein YitT (DUF2179 family)
VTQHAKHSRFDDIQGIFTGALIVAIGIGFFKSAGLLTGGAVGINVLVLWLQERFGWRAGKLQMGLDVSILLCGAFIVPPLLLAASVLGAVLLNFALAVNHKPGRYMAF